MRVVVATALALALAAVAAAQPALTIAMLYPLSGANAAFGAAMRNASILFASMVNNGSAPGGGGVVVGGRRLALALPALDDRSNATHTGLAAGDFLRATNASFLVGARRRCAAR